MPRSKSGKGHTLIGLYDARGAGDAIMMLGVASIIKKNYPHIQIRLENRGGFSTLYRHHPDLSPSIKPTAWLRNINYRMGLDWRSGLNFHQSVAKLYVEPWLDLELKDLDVHPKVFLKKHESKHPYGGKPYSIWYSGSKNDVTVKHLYPPTVSKIVKGLRDRGYQGDCLQFGATWDNHPRIDGTIDKRGVLPPRVLANWFLHADFVVCGASMPLFLAEAVGTRCFCLAGGREVTSYLKMPNNQIYDIRDLDCSAEPCDRYVTVPIGTHWLDSRPCLRPVKTEAGTYPACTLRYNPEELASDIHNYLTGRIALPCLQKYS